MLTNDDHEAAVPEEPERDPGRPLAPSRDGDDTAAPWRDRGRPVAERVAELMARMTVEEKIAQLYGVWVGSDPDGDGVAPYQHEMADEPIDWATLIRPGLGQLTRPFGTAPVEPALGAKGLARAQAEIVAANRFGIPALAHEECLSGFTTWGATIFPVPLAWGASFDPDLVYRMAERIGERMRSVGVHQGLAPVLDVTRDPRWGRTEETIAEDPWLVGTIGTGYVRGLQATGIVATLKHFVGYSASRAGRNLAPAAIGPRELADVLLPPFEMAVRAGARSVMPSYADIDGVPTAADATLLTDLLHRRWGFDGTVVSDYFEISFLEQLHRVAADGSEAAGLALAAGIDVELPTVRCYGEPLLSAVRSGAVPEELVDRAVRRVLTQKCELGLLDPDWDPTPPVLHEDALADEQVSLDPPADRALARQLAEESVVLLANDGALPLPAAARVAVVGPNADDAMAMLGCYSFPSHVGIRYPELPMGVDIPTVLAALRAELPAARIDHVKGCPVDGTDGSDIELAARAAADAEVCVAVLGDRAGLFGRGTSGEGCDADDLRLPGVQQRLLDALVATGTPVVAVLLAGRPYALGAVADRLAAVVQAFFPGEEGGPALAGVLSGRVNPSGRLPVSVPARPGGQPTTYLAPPLGQRTESSTVDPTPLFGFGHGLSYTTFEWAAPQVSGSAAAGAAECGTDGTLTVSMAVRNTGHRAGTEVVQLYLHDPVAQVTRPVVRLIGYARVPLDAGATARVRFEVPADAAGFPGHDGRWLVEPGDIELRLSASAGEARHVVAAHLTGDLRYLDDQPRRTVRASLE